MESVEMRDKEDIGNDCHDANCSDVVSDAVNDEFTQDLSKSNDENSNNTMINDILDHVQNSSAVFKSQQIGDPDLTIDDKRTLAKNLLHKNPFSFLVRFGQFLDKHHFDYFTSLENPEVVEQARQLKIAYHQCNKAILQKNRRYEALKHLEAEGSYFSEAEMEKREPLLYHQLVGQYLTEKEKLIKSRENISDSIPTFSNFLIDKMERENIIAMRKSQEEEEKEEEENSDCEMTEEENFMGTTASVNNPRWGDDWIDEENAIKEQSKKQKKVKKVHLSKNEKSLLLQEFKSLMHIKFLKGLESDFNYDDVDLNPDFDSLETRARDEEEKYFDEESCSNVCTDTGIEDY